VVIKVVNLVLPNVLNAPKQLILVLNVILVELVLLIVLLVLQDNTLQDLIKIVQLVIQNVKLVKMEILQLIVKNVT
jgi:hypothetical protein